MAAGFVLGANALTIDFESGDAGWEYIDEAAENLGDATPGAWEVRPVNSASTETPAIRDPISGARPATRC